MRRLILTILAAWVMWQMEGQKSGDYLWTARESFPTAAACQAKLKVMTERVSQVKGSPEPPTAILNYYQAPRRVRPDMTLWWGCFPNEYDPYAPK